MEFENNLNARVCDVCHERPAAVEVTFLVDGERRNGALCERCARVALAQQGGFDGGQFGGGPGGQFGGGPGFPGASGPGAGRAGDTSTRQRAGTRQRSKTPALDRRLLDHHRREPTGQRTVPLDLRRQDGDCGGSGA